MAAAEANALVGGAEAIALVAVAEVIALVAVAEAIAADRKAVMTEETTTEAVETARVAIAIDRKAETTDDRGVEMTETLATEVDSATATVRAETDPEGAEETTGSVKEAEVTTSATGEATTEEAAEPSKEVRRTEISDAPKANDPGMPTTGRHGTSERPVDLSEKTSKRTWWIER